MPEHLAEHRAHQAAFLAAFATCGNISLASRLTQTGRSTHYLWLKSDPEYKARFEEAMDEAVDRLEEAARKRAEEGVVDYVVSQGKLVYIDDPDNPGKQIPLVRRVYSDSLMALLLKAYRPERFKERQAVEHTGRDGGPIELSAVRERLAGEIARLASGSGETAAS